MSRIGNGRYLDPTTIVFFLSRRSTTRTAYSGAETVLVVSSSLRRTTVLYAGLFEKKIYPTLLRLQSKKGSRTRLYLLPEGKKQRERETFHLQGGLHIPSHTVGPQTNGSRLRNHCQNDSVDLYLGIFVIIGNSA